MTIPKSRMLNVGCGGRRHPDWCNIDLESSGPDVILCDIRNGLPFPNSSFEFVYHSHVLEHLSLVQAYKLIKECHRVLVPGGMLRVAVPDLESIARNYLAALAAAERGAAGGDADHSWMVLELVDQLARTETGGEMKRYLTSPGLPNREFVIARLGLEAQLIIDSAPREGSGPVSHLIRSSPRILFRRCREWALRASARLLLGSSGARAVAEGLFRESGEVHRWMYDRVSLRRILLGAGFAEASVRGANDTAFPDFSRYGLEVVSGRTVKPDSLFMEAVKLDLP